MTEQEFHHVTMNTVVHAAFRRDLSRFEGALAAFPAGSQSRAKDLLRAWDFLADELHHHHGYEEQYFWPALRETDADLSQLEHLDAEHQAMRAALEQATRQMQALRSHPSADRAAAAHAAVVGLREVLLRHLAHEEADLEPISAAYLDSAPMKRALREVKKKHLRSMGNFVEWVQDGATDNDRAALRREIPGPVIAVFGALAGRRYRREVAPVWTR